MKNTEHILSTLALMALAFTRLVAVYSVAKDQQSTVPTKELCTLLKSAKEPSQHLRIAAYYRQEAQRLTARPKKRNLWLHYMKTWRKWIKSRSDEAVVLTGKDGQP